MTQAERVEIQGRLLILYDGVCGLCNRVVRLLLRVDRAGILRYAPLESPIGVEMLSHFATPPGEPEGVILITGALTPREAIYRRFDAVAEAMRQIHGPFAAAAALLRLVPRPVREWSYGLIARHRYQIFGKVATCPIPTLEQRGRILGL